MSIFEVVELARRGRLELDPSVRSWVREGLSRPRVRPLALTPEIAIDSAQLRFEASPADRIIYATARAEDASLITRDERIHAFDPQLAVW